TSSGKNGRYERTWLVDEIPALSDWKGLVLDLPGTAAGQENACSGSPHPLAAGGGGPVWPKSRPARTEYPAGAFEHPALLQADGLQLDGGGPQRQSDVLHQRWATWSRQKMIAPQELSEHSPGPSRPA